MKVLVWEGTDNLWIVLWDGKNTYWPRPSSGYPKRPWMRKRTDLGQFHLIGDL